MKKLFLYLFFLSNYLGAESKYPADISYMVADLKYSQEYGVKICEIQHGILSTFLGDVFLHGDDGLLCPKIEQVFAVFPMTKWVIPMQVSFPKLLKAFQKSANWKSKYFFASIANDSEFIQNASALPSDPHSIDSYKGMIYAKPNTIKNYETFSSNYPGILVIDAPTHPYWIDKYKMTSLFNKDPKLAAIKPEWGLYSKIYSSLLTAQIVADIPAEAYVIKPRGGFLGNGVIIVPKDALDATLNYILNKDEALKKDKDLSYSYWYHDTFDSFIIEKYYPSDIIQVDELAGKFFEPTMRVAVVMLYNNKKIDIRILGGYWILPHKALDEQGTFNELKKAYCKVPFFTKASDAIVEEVRQQLAPALTILYQAMLEGS